MTPEILLERNLPNHQKCPPAFLQALTDVVGVTVVCFVKVAPNVMIFVVVAKLSLRCVFVGVGSVIVLVYKPEKTVAAGRVVVVV